MKVLIPNSLDLDMPPTPGLDFVTYDVAAPIPAEHHDAEVLVAWGNPAEMMPVQAGSLPRLKLVQSLAAGGDHARQAAAGPNVALAAGNGLHDATVTEHALALTLALLRRVPALLEAQRAHRWDKEGTVGPQVLHPKGMVNTLIDASVTIWGYGHIGRRLAPVLEALGAHVAGLAHSRRTEGSVEVFPAGTPGHLTDEAADVLRGTDVLIMILPSQPDTEHFLDAAALDLLPRRAFVVNVGRGSTVDQEALAAALCAGSIAGAALDVTSPEPLPADSPLWDAATIISPHVAGGRPVDAEALIVRNALAVLNGTPVENRLN
ncbi:NAD(P)-dependent oxidoreductase [Neoactinobaculum massilliense]|uniref:NAD(P)-dependent oxidoreductase n=1 Tax=Neoactinobaculum massilliense TaxID=2364794 RepID=UPI000F5458AA|nr:NAD(P)-dependent oxidoreductase [Neoactinobaculum massilliense]